MRMLNQIHALLLKDPKPQILNPWLGYLTTSSAPQNALFLYNRMLHHPTSHNHYTFTYALKACCFLHLSPKGREIQAHVTKDGHISDIFIQNSLLYFYVVQSDIVSAARIFDSIPVPDVVSWTSMISGLSKCGFVEEAIVKFMNMDIKPNPTTLVTVFSSCSSLRALMFGKAVHCYCLRNLHESNLILDNAILDFYLRCGSLASAKYLFVKMPKRDVISWTSMVGGYAQCYGVEAVKLFQQMVQVGEAEPNEATIVNVLSACSLICALSSGEQVHHYISTRQDLMVNVNVGNALMNMYVKCGNLGMAISVFKAMERKDIISWTTIISGMAMNGHGFHVRQIFSSMLVNGVSPDSVTFLGLLTACSHDGLVDQGLMFFDAMKKVHQIVPETQHYACLVDIYGRAGLLEEAEAFIKEMPMEADGPVWGALLSACKIHGNEEMVERIREGLRNSTKEQVTHGTDSLPVEMGKPELPEHKELDTSSENRQDELHVGSAAMETDSEDMEQPLAGAVELAADDISNDQFIQLSIFHLMVLVHRTMENAEICRLFVEKSGFEPLVKLLLQPAELKGKALDVKAAGMTKERKKYKKKQEQLSIVNKKELAVGGITDELTVNQESLFSFICQARGRACFEGGGIVMNHLIEDSSHWMRWTHVMILSI